MGSRRRVLFQQFTSAVLFVVVLSLVGWLSTRYTLEADWTAGGRNTLTEPSRRQLDAMNGPVRFLVFVYPRSEIRQSLEADLNRYRRFKEDIAVEFIDPSTNPQKVREYNVSRAGEVVVEYQGRRENLAATSEPAITTALQRLSDAGERWVVFLEGHGERGINDTEQQGYSAFAGLLRDKGLKVRALNLATDPAVPDNASVLVLAAPARPLLDGEAKILADYLARGGNLLWLADPDTPPAAAGALGAALGITWQQGTGILLESAALGLPPFVYITTHYPPNPVTKDFPQNVLFPLVRGLAYRSDTGWNVQPLLTSTEDAWLETGVLEGELTLEPERGDTPGPLTIGVTLARDAPGAAAGAGDEGADAPPKRQQRVAVIGDSDFLSNGYFGQLGNSLLGLNLAQWLSSRDQQLNIDVPRAPDRSLMLPAWGFYSIYVLFAFLLPAGLVGVGATRWVIRRRR